MNENLVQDIRAYVGKRRLSAHSWGRHLPNSNCLFYKETDDDTIGVQIYVLQSERYETYRAIKDEITEIFMKYDYGFYAESDLNENGGWFKEIHFRRKAVIMENQKKAESQGNINHININVADNATLAGVNIAGNDNVVKTTLTSANKEESILKKLWSAIVNRIISRISKGRK
jgi:hypothetical protein